LKIRGGNKIIPSVSPCQGGVVLQLLLLPREVGRGLTNNPTLTLPLKIRGGNKSALLFPC